MTQESRLPKEAWTGQDRELSEQLGDQVSLDYFMAETFPADDLEPLGAYAIRQVVDSILLLNRRFPEPSYSSNSSRDNALRRMRENKKARKRLGQKGPGLPKTAAEFRTVTNNGPEEKLSRAARTSKGNQTSAADSTFAAMEGYRLDSLKEIQVYSQVMAETPRGDLVKDINLLRQNQEALRLVGDHLMHREFLDKMVWPSTSSKQYKLRQQYWRGCLAAAARYASPSVLGAIMPGVVMETEERLGYWTEKTHKIATQLPAGIAVKSRMMTVPGWLDRERMPDPEIEKARAEWVKPVPKRERPPELTLSLDQAAVVDRRDTAGDSSAYLAQLRAGAPKRGGVARLVNAERGRDYGKKLEGSIQESQRARIEAASDKEQRAMLELIKVMRGKA